MRLADGRVGGFVLASAPTVAFVAGNAAGGLDPGLVAAGITATVGFAVRVARREPVRAPALGLLLVAACAAAAALTGQARAFFLLPALVPFAAVLACAGSLLVGRPLTGVLLNRAAGGPPDWWTVGPVRRVHALATAGCAAISVLNATMQAICYAGNQTAVLAAVHVGTGPVFAAVAAATVVRARRASRPIG